MKLLKEEAKSILNNRKLLIPIIAILFIPILYTGMFLWAFWDPYDRLQDLPVAIVNEDEGAEFEGKELKLGNELVKNLKDSKEFDFKFVDKKDGYRNLEKEEYYMLVEIPNDFSQRATTLLEDHPQKLSLIYVPNEGYNFLSAQIGGTAIDQIKFTLSEKITETYAETMFDKITEMADGLSEAEDGASALNKGIDEVNEGSKTLHDSLSTLAAKSIQFSSGVYDAKQGSIELASGANALEEGLGQLQSGHQRLSEAANELESGSGELSSGISQTRAGIQEINEKFPTMINGTEDIKDGSQSLSAGLQSWQNEMNQYNAGVVMLQQNMEEILTLLPEESQEKAAIQTALNSLTDGSRQLADSAGQLANGGNTISNKLGELSAGQTQIQAGIQQLEDAAKSLEAGSGKLAQGQNDFHTGMNEFGTQFETAITGATRLAKGADTLSSGLNELEQGSLAMQDGTNKLTDGASKLTQGNNELLDGSNELASKLGEGADKAGSVTANDETYEMMAGPVEVKNNKINTVPNYGTGFAPYFISLGLFVGALLLSIVFPLRQPAIPPRNAASWFGSKLAVISGVGIIQALIAVFLLIAFLDIKVQSLPLFILFAIITSLTFITLIQFFVTAFGDPGRFIAIVILILQLTTSAGTFPLELIPEPLQAFNAFLPMTYSVSGFKAVITSGDFSYMWHNAGILSGFILLFLICSFTYFHIAFKKKYNAIIEQ
ncbi:YhgE/Pip domain-containing protein [Cytobacillus horneckiae]|uniref:YhgE/Pip family protein n=1 Tax=Cytobacillus horneckiae TaxID=549687 RepID=UPI0039A0A68D